MEALIQLIETGQYLKDEGVWVEKREEAMRFRGGLAAVDFCERHKFRKPVRIVLAVSDDPRKDLILPWDGSRKRGIRNTRRAD